MGAAAAGLLIVGFFFLLPRLTEPPLSAILRAPPDILVRAEFDEAGGVLIAERQTGQAPIGQIHRVWFLRPGMDAIPIGNLDPLGVVSVPLRGVQAEQLLGATLILTQEPIGTSDPILNTDAVIARGVISRL